MSFNPLDSLTMHHAPYLSSALFFPFLPFLPSPVFPRRRYYGSISNIEWEDLWASQQQMPVGKEGVIVPTGDMSGCIIGNS